MKEIISDKKKFLKALIEYAQKSGTFNPHFQKKELMDLLDITEGKFNIIQKRLGDKYCYFVSNRDGNDRYGINVSDCLSLQEQYDQEIIQELRHNQLVRLSVLVAILGAVIGVALVIWLHQ